VCACGGCYSDINDMIWPLQIPCLFSFSFSLSVVRFPLNRTEMWVEVGGVWGGMGCKKQNRMNRREVLDGSNVGLVDSYPRFFVSLIPIRPLSSDSDWRSSHNQNLFSLSNWYLEPKKSFSRSEKRTEISDPRGNWFHCRGLVLESKSTILQKKKR
jgi:hypothetical protein